MTTRTAHRDTQAYTVQNIDNKAKTLIVEHPIRREAKLISPKPAETTATAYRFELKLASSAAEKLTVVEEREFENSYTISSVNSDFLLSYVRNEKLIAAARAQLEKLTGLKGQVEEVDRAARQVETDIRNLERDQDRLRQNINSLNQVSGQQEQVGRYARTLADQETKLAGLRDRQAELARQKTSLESEISGLMDKMEF
jgi:chromosome segregation ATPase